MKRNISIFLLSIFLLALPSALAGTKEELVRLQSDVLALQNQVREFDKNYNERLEGLKSLVVQLNDQVARSQVVLDKVSRALENQTSGIRSNDQTLLQEIRTLSGKIDDVSTRVSVLAQQIAEVKLQSKPLTPASAPGETCLPNPPMIGHPAISFAAIMTSQSRASHRISTSRREAARPLPLNTVSAKRTTIRQKCSRLLPHTREF